MWDDWENYDCPGDDGPLTIIIDDIDEFGLGGPDQPPSFLQRFLAWLTTLVG